MFMFIILNVNFSADIACFSGKYITLLQSNGFMLTLTLHLWLNTGMCVSRESDKGSASKPVGLANVSYADKEEGHVIQKHFIGDSKHEWAPSKHRRCNARKSRALEVKHPSLAPWGDELRSVCVSVMHM